jgi:hypothetical protein
MNPITAYSSDRTKTTLNRTTLRNDAGTCEQKY